MKYRLQLRLSVPRSQFGGLVNQDGTFRVSRLVFVQPLSMYIHCVFRAKP